MSYTFDPNSFAIRRKSNFDIKTDPEHDSFFTKIPPQENVSKMTEILNHLLVLADDKRKTDSLSKSPKHIYNNWHLSSGKTGRHSLVKATNVGKTTNFDQKDDLTRPVQTLESITDIFSTVVKVLFGYEFSDKPTQDIQTLQAKRGELNRDKIGWNEIKSTFEDDKQAKIDGAFNKVNSILISREKYLQKIRYHRIALVALSVIALAGILLAKRSWTALGLVACSVNLIFMFTNYISSTETQAQLNRELKPLVNACRIEQKEHNSI